MVECCNIAFACSVWRVLSIYSAETLPLPVQFEKYLYSAVTLPFPVQFGEYLYSAVTLPLSVQFEEYSAEKLSLPVQFGEYRYSAERMTWDPNCYECKVRYRDPKPKDLVMYLHAWVYKVLISVIANICGTNTKKTTGIDCFLAKSLLKTDFFPVIEPFYELF
jgi:hypothetical protein